MRFLWGAIFLLACSYRSEIKIIPKKEEKKKTNFEPQEENWNYEVPKIPLWEELPSKELQEKKEISLEKAKISRKKSQKLTKKLIPIHYFGDEFIREIIPNKDPKEGTIITIKGHAQIQRQNQIILADKIEIFGEDGAYIRAFGNLRLIDKKNKLQVKAEVAEYYKLENRLILKGSPQAEWINQDKTKSFLFCQEWERFFDKKFSYCRKNVKFQKDSLSIYGKLAELDEENKTIILSENPHLFQNQNILVAQMFTYSQKEKSEKLFAKNSLRVYYTETSKDKKTLTSVIEASEGILEKSEDIHLGQKITLKGNPITLRREDFYASSQEAIIYGENAQEVFLYQQVYLKNRKDGSYMQGENFRFYRALGIVQMESEIKDGQKIRPRGYFFGDNEKVVVEAESFERNIFLNRIYARGGVEIRWTDNKNEAFMRGEWAELRQEKELLSLYGNPSLSQGGGEIFAKQILIFYREKRYELIGPLHGSMLELSQ